MSIFRDDFLEGKVAVITGGGSGIGKGIAAELMAHGASTAIVSRNAERLQASAAELEATCGRACLPVQADVRQPTAVEAAFAQTLERFGRLDVVVNAAAGNFLCPAAQLSYNGFRTVMEIDAMGTYNVSRAAFDAWLRDHGGAIVNISATLHYGATPLQTHAAAAKAAVDSLTRSLALEWGGLGIRVNGVAPGPIDGTEGMARLSTPEIRDRLEKTIPLGRFGTIDEIAQVVLFLCSDAARLIHGETVVVDGGAWLGSGLGGLGL